MSVDPALASAVAVGLPGAPVVSTAAGPGTVTGAVEHRVQGLLWRAIAAGRVSADHSVRSAARDAHLAALRTSLMAEETAVLACTALDAAGVDSRVLKGIAISHLDHDDPAERVFGDADVLVRRADHGRALAALTGAGFVRSEPPVRSWWERRFGKAIVMQAPNGGELDLHLSLTGGYYGEALDMIGLMDHPGDRTELAGRSVRTLDRHDRLLQACCHSVLGGASGLRAQRDIAQLVLITGADWQLAAERAGEANVVVATALARAWQTLALDDHPANVWAGGFRASERQRRALATYQAAFTSTWAPEGRGILAALSPIDRVRFAIGVAFPSQASLRSRDRTVGQHLRQIVSSIR